MRGRGLIRALRRPVAARADRGDSPPTDAPPRRRSRSFAGMLGAGVLLLGLLLVGYALAQPAKALVGQWLLERAWRTALAAPGVTEAGAAPSAAPPAAGGPKPWSWADMRPIAKLSFPSLGAERVVVDSASGEALAWAPGHVAGTAALGERGLTAIAAHRDTHFALLEHVKPGDRIEVKTADGGQLTYEVLSGHVVDAQRFRLPPPDASAPDILALSTCWPFDSVEPGPERYVLFAARIETPA